MVKRHKTPKGKTSQAGDNSDDDDGHGHVPDPQSYDYYHDEIDAFHDRKEKILLTDGPLNAEPAGSSSEDEVLGLDLADSDESDDERIAGYKRSLRKLRRTTRKYKIDDDVEEDDKGKSWGKKKYNYYGADVDDSDELELEEGEGEDGDTGAALMEEQEAIALQKKMVEQLDEQDFGLDSFLVTKPTDEITKGEKIKKDFSQLSRREKLNLFQKDSPEFMPLRDDYIDKMTTVVDVLVPIQELIARGDLPRGKASAYINSRIRLYLNYCVNINFYMVLKAKQIAVQSHPVVKRILQYRNLIKKLEEVNGRIKDELDDILRKSAIGEDLGCTVAVKHTPSTKSLESRKALRKNMAQVRTVGDTAVDTTKAVKEKTLKKSERTEHIETSGEREASMYYRAAHGLPNSDDEEEDVDNEEDKQVERTSRSEDAMETNTEEGNMDELEGKRGITYQMAKNKGLVVKKKKKLLSNPRVKHRMKYKKALIKRRSAVREAKLPLAPYRGEMTGIRAGLKHGIKLQ